MFVICSEVMNNGSVTLSDNSLWLTIFLISLLEPSLVYCNPITVLYNVFNFEEEVKYFDLLSICTSSYFLSCSVIHNVGYLMVAMGKCFCVINIDVLKALNMFTCLSECILLFQVCYLSANMFH